MKSDSLVLGVGSEHGDDAIGWRVTDRIAGESIDSVACQKIATPIELLDWLDAAHHIHLIDAAAELPDSVMQFSLRNESEHQRLADQSATCTHDFGVARTIELATALGKSLNHVHLWLVAGFRFDRLDPISKRAEQSIQICAEQLAQMIRNSDSAGLT